MSEIDPGLTMLKLNVETVSGEKYMFFIDRAKTVVIVPWEKRYYDLISTGPIAVGWKLRGKYSKGTKIYPFESDKVAKIIATFELNQMIR